jgi:NAD(P)-dependent dehydrogenase (short-subunit alcohol dehydrogenase family)
VKVALVTGGGRGIGRATALALAGVGASVVVLDRDGAAAEETARLAGEGAAVVGDVTRSEDLERAVAVARERWGGLDWAVNNAGITLHRKLRAHEIDEADWRRILDVNLTGVFLAMRAEVPALLERGGGAIVNISSVAGLVGSSAADAAYAASKHGIVGLTKTAALDYATAGIRVNAICPGPVNTPMVADAAHMGDFFKRASPMERIAEPEEIAAAAVWLCSEAASFVTGTAVPVDGGYVAR